MARGKLKPNTDQGERSASRRPRPFPRTVSTAVPVTPSGCPARGSPENLPGPQQPVTPDDGDEIRELEALRPPAQHGPLNQPDRARGLRHASRAGWPPDKVRMRECQSRETSRQRLAVLPPQVTDAQNDDFDSEVKRILREVTTRTQEHL